MPQSKDWLLDMRLRVLARHDLVDFASGAADGALLLEGTWPSQPTGVQVNSLDDAIDARFAWIDEAAVRRAETLSGATAGLPSSAEGTVGQANRGTPQPDLDRPATVNPYWLNALALRYYLVKLIRVVAYFSEVAPVRHSDSVEFLGAAGRDEDYAFLLEQICRKAGADYRVRMDVARPSWPCWSTGWKPVPRKITAWPRNSRMRRSFDRLRQLLEPSPRPAASRRVVLVGNPRLLDPVCRELIAAGAQVWWLYDRFAITSWLRWRPLGCGQLTCNSSDVGMSTARVDMAPSAIDCRGIDLGVPVAQWLERQLQSHGARQSRILDAMDAHLRRIRPHAVVLDEDATTFARAAVAVARRFGSASYVVQHGAPCCRFSFAPPAADGLFAWGESSRRQLIDWGVIGDRIQVTGSPYHDRLVGQHAGQHRRSGRKAGGTSPVAKVLLLATVPPRDARPDAVTLHLTRASYAEMLRMAAAAVERIGGAELIVKLHPRAAGDPIVRRVLAKFPTLPSRVVSTGDVQALAAEADCVLSCPSSAGIEATLTGTPVIQLAAPGSGSVLPHDEWGTFGTARIQPELERLLALVATRRAAVSSQKPDADVFANLNGLAAARIARAVMADPPAPPSHRLQPVGLSLNSPSRVSCPLSLIPHPSSSNF